MRFATRTFLWSFIPFALLLLGSFAAIQRLVELAVRDGLRSSLRQTHASIARLRSKTELEDSRFLKILGENASLKAGLQLLLADPGSRDARLTVEDQLREICGPLGFDFLMVSNAEGLALAGVLRVDDQFAAMDTAQIRPPHRGFMTLDDRAYQIVSTPVDEGDENLGILSIGERFDFSEFTTPAVLLHDGKVLKSSIPGVGLEEVEQALGNCRGKGECEVKLRGETFLSLPMESIYFGSGYALRSLQSVDSASAPVQSILRTVFLFAGGGALLAMVFMGVLSSRSIVKPIAEVVGHLRESEKTGLLPEFHSEGRVALEIRELRDSFNRAAAAIREGRSHLQRAYVEFVGSLASALDARDRYTAGHSRRVSEYSCAIAKAMGLIPEEVERIQIGALLHDIGKIGIADSVLQKPGRLTPEEMSLIRQHPTIGRQILEGVQGFHPYLGIVELHHEDWDGGGYPLGLRGEATPECARIVHVADAYDAMTSDRPYRKGMSHEEAVRILERFSGAQFDPVVVAAFLRLNHTIEAEPDITAIASLQGLATSLNGNGFAPGSESLAEEHR